MVKVHHKNALYSEHFDVNDNDLFKPRFSVGYVAL